MLDTYLDQLALGFFEVTEAFGGLADENVWKRPAPGLLSVGELAGHIAYGEASRFGGNNADHSADNDLTNLKIQSPLLDPRFSYYTSNVENEVKLDLSASQVMDELLRIHGECMESLKTLNPDLESRAPHWGGSYRELLKYLAFHVSYHTGQMYSVRHLLGEHTPDN